MSTEIQQAVEAAISDVAAETAFSGAVRVDFGPEIGGAVTEAAFGMADRRFEVPMRIDTPMSIASGTKGFTALVAMALVEAGSLSLDLPVRKVLGTDLPLIDDRVTVRQLLAHRSGIGDYLDEAELGDISDYAMPVPVQQLDSAEAYLPVLDGHPSAFAPDAQFAYNNSGYVVLAIVAERVTGTAYGQLVDDLVCAPAGLSATGFHRSDSLPTGYATGYLAPDGLRTNSLHLPVLGVGDGGLFSTVVDMQAFWRALFDGRIVSMSSVELMTRSHTESTGESSASGRYGLGFWLAAEGSGVRLEGYDAGVSFVSGHDPSRAVTYTVISNTSEGAWPMARALDSLVGPGPAPAAGE